MMILWHWLTLIDGGFPEYLCIWHKCTIFSDDDDFDDDPPSPEPTNRRVIGRCKAVYDYQGEQADELVLQHGKLFVYKGSSIS